MKSAMAIALELAEDGIKSSADHANRKHDGWTDLAYSRLVRFAINNHQFISEDLSDATEREGFPQPPTLKAWGSVYRRANKNGVIRQVGIGRSRRRHGSICPQWQSMICK